MDVQVIGTGGLLGAYVARAVRERGWRLVAPVFNTITATSSDIHAPLVVNCGAIADRNAPKWKVIEVNALAPHVIAKACSQAGARLVHVTTDQMFEGAGPHSEMDAPDSQEFLSYSRLFGEPRGDEHVALRAPVIGVGYKGIVKDLMESSPGRPVIASDRVLLNVVLVPVLANLILEVGLSKVTGVLHVPAQHMSRWEFCKMVADWLACEYYLRRDDSVCIDRRLVSVKWHKAGLPSIPSLEQQLASAAKVSMHQMV